LRCCDSHLWKLEGGVLAYPARRKKKKKKKGGDFARGVDGGAKGHARSAVLGKIPPERGFTG
jgi:hypothetical protein